MSDQASGSGPKPDAFERGAGFESAPQEDREDPLARLERLGQIVENRSTGSTAGRP